MRKSFLFALSLLAGTASAAWGQALPTASRAGDLQIGGGYVIAQPDYGNKRFNGYSIYADFDFKAHWGIEADYHSIKEPDSDGPRYMVYEHTYEIGGRYLYPIRNFSPYAKFLVGRGVFNFNLNNVEPDTDPHANLAYNIYAAGLGIDYRATRSINVRIDYEYQRWPSFQQKGLQPNLVTIGAAYHFH